MKKLLCSFAVLAMIFAVSSIDVHACGVSKGGDSSSSSSGESSDS